MWAKAKRAADHYDVSVRTMRRWQSEGFPHVKVRGSVLFDLDRGDDWLRENYAPDSGGDLDQLLRGM